MNALTNTTELDKASSVDVLESMLLIEEQTKNNNKEVKAAIAATIAAADMSDEASILDAENAIVAAIPSTELAITTALEAKTFVNTVIDSIIAKKLNAAALRNCTRSDIKSIVAYLVTLPEATQKEACGSIARSQKHITDSLTAESHHPQWVWMDENKAKSLKIRFDALKGEAVTYEKLEGKLQLDLLGSLRSEQLLHKMLTECKNSVNDDAVWAAAFDTCLVQVAGSKTQNKSILDLVTELTPRYLTANLEQYEFAVRKGYDSLTLEKLEAAETLLDKADSKNEEVKKHKAELKQAVASYHANRLTSEQKKELEQKEIAAIMARLETLDLKSVLLDYEIIKAKYGPALDKIDALSDELIAAYALIEELKAALTTKPAKRTGTKG